MQSNRLYRTFDFPELPKNIPNFRDLQIRSSVRVYIYSSKPFTSLLKHGWWFQPLWKIWKSIGMIIPHTWKIIQMFRTTSQMTQIPGAQLRQLPRCAASRFCFRVPLKAPRADRICSDLAGPCAWPGWFWWEILWYPLVSSNMAGWKIPELNGGF